MKFLCSNWTVLALAVFPISHAHAEELISPIATESLAGEAVKIPDDLPDAPVLLIIGFTRGSQEHVAKWSEKVRTDDPLSDLNVREAAVIEGAPGLVRGLIIRGIRKEVPKAMHDQFLLVMKGSGDLKKLVNYDGSDDPFLILLDKDHSVLWKAKGKFSESLFTELKSQLTTIGLKNEE